MYMGVFKLDTLCSSSYIIYVLLMYVYLYVCFINIVIIILIEHIKKLAEDTSLSEHIHKCKLTVNLDCMWGNN